MSVVVTACLLAAAVVALITSHRVKFGVALVCVVFGLVLGASPVGPPVNTALSGFGDWVWHLVTTL